MKIAVHTGNDIQWFRWQSGIVQVQEGERLIDLAYCIENHKQADDIINAYMQGKEDATSTNPKTAAPR